MYSPIPILLIVVVAFLLLWGAIRLSRPASGKPRVLLTGGGTGGHVNPALAIAEGIKARDPDTRFLYVGVRDKAEAVIVRRAGYPLVFVWSEGFPGLRISWAMFRFLFRVGIGILQAVVILIRFAPDRVVATGGYVSAPIIFAALILRCLRLSSVRIFLHEQNSIPGQFNGFLGRWVDRVLLTFPQTLSFFPKNGVVVGYPIRHSVVLKGKEEALAGLTFKIPEGRKVVFAFGGSQGARTINRAMVDALKFLLPFRDQLFIIHGMGLKQSGDYNTVTDTEGRIEAKYTPEERARLDGFYYRQDYFHNIADVYSISDLIVCRSGAGSLNEISRLGKPVILIPKANLPGDHQVMNARAMKQVGAAEILFEDTVVEDGEVLEKLEGEYLAERIIRLLEEPERLDDMAAHSRRFLRRNAVERILSELYGESRFNDPAERISTPFKPLLTHQQLLDRLNASWSRAPEFYDPVTVLGDEDDLIYYRHRSAALLSRKPWQTRNLGVKLVGVTRYEEKIPTLLHMLADRTPVGRFKRLLGGDFRQVGFIRRNIVQALRVINLFTPAVERGLLGALRDPYFEVRSQACIAAAHFGTHIAGREKWMDALTECLDDRCFEVVVEAAKAVGEAGLDGHAAAVLLNLKDSHYWQVRDAALKGIKRLMDRRVIAPSADLLGKTSSFILTSTDFRPYFSIKETYRTIRTCCNERAGSDPSACAATKRKE